MTSRPAAARCEQPGADNLVEDVYAHQGERTPIGGLVRRAAARAERGQHVRARVRGSLPDRGERPRARDHRRDPDGQQPGQLVPPISPFTRVRDLGQHGYTEVKATKLGALTPFCITSAA